MSKCALSSSLVSASLVECDENTEASQYICDHYKELLEYCHIKTGEPAGMYDKTYDLMGDVCESIVNAENNGNGFNIGYSNEGDLIEVDKFVKGRIDGYAKNTKYQHGNKASQMKKDTSGRVTMSIMCASYDEGAEPDELNEFQAAMKNAQSANDFEDIEDSLCIRRNIEFCLDFDCGINMLALINNVDEIANVDVKSGLFDKLRATFELHDELKDAFISVMKMRETNRAEFDRVLSMTNKDYGYAF